MTSTPTPPQPISAMISEDGEFHLLPGFTNASPPGPILRETLTLAFNQNLTMTGAGYAYKAGAGPTAETGTVTSDGFSIPRRVIVQSYQNGSETGVFHLNFVPRLYDQPSTIELIEGKWNLRDESLAALGSITIKGDGTFSGTTANGCAETGSFTIIDSKFSVYRVAVNQAACAGAPAGSFSGLSTIQGTNNPNDTLVTEISNPATAIMNYITTY